MILIWFSKGNYIKYFFGVQVVDVGFKTSLDSSVDIVYYSITFSGISLMGVTWIIIDIWLCLWVI